VRNRAARRRRERRSQLVFTGLAVAIICALVLSGVLVLLDFGSGDGASNGDTIRVTPGAEVMRLETAIADNPDDVNNVVVLAEILANSGRVAESIHWYERAIALRPDDPQLRLSFGRALQRGGGWFDAEVQFRRALELDPGNIAAAYYLGQLNETMPTPRIEAAREWYELAIELDPDSLLAEQAREHLAVLDGTPVSGTPPP
jgi:cytochrome c-type biogenesis protein CcmH/NrfG